MKVFNDMFRRMAVSAIWYVIIFPLVIIAVSIFVAIGGEEFDLTLDTIVNYSNHVYLLVIGIISPLVYFTRYVAVGVTRKQIATSLLCSAIVLAAVFALINIPLMLIFGDFYLMQIPTAFARGFASFTIGWLAVSGFHFMRGVPITLGIVCAVALLNSLSHLWRLPQIAELAIITAIALALAYALLRITQNIELRN
jgi:hypothetical protein